jgi:hypothetical protein
MFSLITLPVAKINQFDFPTVSLVLWYSFANIVMLKFDFICNLMIFKSLIIILVMRTTFIYPYTLVQDVLVIRKIHPCLPSFKAEFTAAVPLTRIRDIAHRNDIPHDLKVMTPFQSIT